MITTSLDSLRSSINSFFDHFVDEETLEHFNSIVVWVLAYCSDAVSWEYLGTHLGCPTCGGPTDISPTRAKAVTGPELVVTMIARWTQQ